MNTFVPEFVAWEWTDDNLEPKYIGFGKIVNGQHPAAMLWESRDTLNSQLGDWLKGLTKEPHRAWKFPETAMLKSDARQLAQARRLQLRKKRKPLLSARPYGTVKGGGAPLVVIDEFGNRFGSVREAATAHGISGATVTRRCQNPLSGWCLSNS